MLNLFAYTCSFSLVAAKLGQYKTSSVGQCTVRMLSFCNLVLMPIFSLCIIDISRRFLDQGIQNFKANDIDTSDHHFFEEDALPFLDRAAKQGLQYDVVVCDPPTLFNALPVQQSNRPRGGVERKEKVLSCNKHYDELVRLSAAVVKADGFLVLFCNSKSLRMSKWLDMVNKGISACHIEQARRGGSGNTGDLGEFEIVHDLFASTDFRESEDEPDLKGLVRRKVLRKNTSIRQQK